MICTCPNQTDTNKSSCQNRSGHWLQTKTNLHRSRLFPPRLEKLTAETTSILRLGPAEDVRVTVPSQVMFLQAQILWDQCLCLGGFAHDPGRPSHLPGHMLDFLAWLIFLSPPIAYDAFGARASHLSMDHLALFACAYACIPRRASGQTIPPFWGNWSQRRSRDFLIHLSVESAKILCAKPIRY